MDDWKKNLGLFAAPVVFVILTMVIGIYVLLISATFGMDKGLLIKMVQPEFARGVITYLFAVTTIGTAAVLVLASLTGEVSEASDKQFQRGKEVLSLLMGVFGTIVGFYFAADIKTSSRDTLSLRVNPPLVEPRQVASGANFTIRATVTGGTPPYKYATAVGPASIVEYDQNVREDGWIVRELVAPDVQKPATMEVKLGVKDALGAVGSATATLEVTPKATTPPAQ